MPPEAPPPPFLDFAIVALQAYVFTVLTASYIQGSLAEGH